MIWIGESTINKISAIDLILQYASAKSKNVQV